MVAGAEVGGVNQGNKIHLVAVCGVAGGIIENVGIGLNGVRIVVERVGEDNSVGLVGNSGAQGAFENRKGVRQIRHSGEVDRITQGDAVERQVDIDGGGQGINQGDYIGVNRDGREVDRRHKGDGVGLVAISAEGGRIT